MRFITDCVDYGDASTELITGLAMVVEVDDDAIEVLHYRTHIMPDGSTENRIVGRHRWSRRNLAQAQVLLENAMTAFQRQHGEKRVALLATAH
jgi:hypothetical protein